MTAAILSLALLAAPAGRTALEDNELTAERGRTVRVDVSHNALFGVRWRRPIVRTGIFRRIGTSFGGPGISRVHPLVVVGSGEGVVRGMSLDNGRLVWHYRHKAPFESSVAIIDATEDANGRPDEMAVLGSRDGSLVALEVATGRLRWEARLEGDPRAPARRVGDKLLVTTSNNQVFVLTLKDGQVVWSKGRPAPTGLTVTGQARAAVSGGVVCAAFSDGYVEAYRLADGSSLWSRPLSLRGGDFVDADADPVFVNKTLYVASYSDGIYALNVADGQTLWQRPAPSVTTLAAFESLLIAASADGYVWGLEQSGGVLVYRMRLAPGPPSRMLIRDHLAAFTMGENGLVVLDPLSGEPLQASAFGDLFAGDVSWVGDDLTFLGSSGYLYALRRVH